jgi:hypothetical protein
MVVATLVAVTVALGSAAPEASRTLPTNSALAICAWHREQIRKIAATKQSVLANQTTFCLLCFLTTALAS